MAVISIRIPERLKQKVQELAKREGVSFNNFVSATLAAAVAQEEARVLFGDRLRDMDLAALHRRVMAFMGDSQPGPEPSPEQIDRARGRT